jgi:hypothetical protein
VRWKIKSSFKKLKQDISSRTSQCRNAQAEYNHLQFYMMALMITWIYADRLNANPEHRHKGKGKISLAFSDVLRLMGEAALNDDLKRFCRKPGNPRKYWLGAILLSTAA